MKPQRLPLAAAPMTVVKRGLKSLRTHARPKKFYCRARNESMKRVFKFGVGALATVALLFLVLQFLPPRGKVAGQNPWRPRPGQRPLVIAHGGGQGLHPPNTLEAFAHAVALQCDALEMDLRITRDDILVTLHDETIDRTSDG